jgi:hypothetical protein
LIPCRRELANADQQCAGTLLDDGRKSRRDLAFGRANESQQTHPENTGRSPRPVTGTVRCGYAVQVCNRVSRWHQFVQHLQALSGYFIMERGDPREIARGTIEARYHANLDGVVSHHENNRDSLCRRLRGKRRTSPHGDNHSYMPANKISSDRRLLADMVPGGVNGHVAARDITGLCQSLAERR